MKNKGCNHEHSEEEWVMWADLAVSGLQRRDERVNVIVGRLL